MKEITLKDGVTLEYGDAGFESALQLKNAIFNEIINRGLKIEGLKDDFSIENLAKIELKGQVFETIIKSVLAVDTSRSVQDSVHICMQRCKLKGEKISTETFNAIENRAYYYPVKFHVIKETLIPFFQDLVSLLKAFIPQI